VIVVSMTRTPSATAITCSTSPRAGIHGAMSLQGQIGDLVEAPNSWTGKYLSGE